MSDASRPIRLRADHLVDPLGLGPRPPRLSWWLPAGAAAQRAYRVVAGAWDSGIVESAQSTSIHAQVPPVSGRRVTWRVKVWTDLGESEWSDPSVWEHGLLAASDWTAAWVEPLEPADSPDRQRPAYLLAAEFTLDGDVETARLHATAHGLYEAYVNGERVGDEELTPGFTAYRRRVQVTTFDVTDLLVSGVNAWGAVLSDGWWRGQQGAARRVDDYGPRTAFLAMLVVTLTSGDVVTFGTGPAWRSSPSHIRRADLIAGENHDRRLRVEAWASPGTSRSEWSPATVADHGLAELCHPVAPPVRRVEELAPVSVTECAAGGFIVDFGQNSNGWIRLDHVGPEAATTTIVYGEALTRNGGDVVQANVSSGILPSGDVPFQTDVVVSDGSDEAFEPRHSTKGFRYVRVHGPGRSLDPGSIVSVVVHTDFERLGGFACSDDRLNAIHRVADWSFRGNACDIPTDCPTRERAGWTGDWQIYVETAAFLYDVTGFSAKWLRDLAADQLETGAVTPIVPEPHLADGRGPGWWSQLTGSAGWGDAAVHVPWEIYRATGDPTILADQWSSMTAWVDYAAAAAAGGRYSTRAERFPTPRPHDEFLWDSGFHFGEWLEPDDDLEAAGNKAFTSDHGALATSYLYRSTLELSQAADVLGEVGAADRYRALAARVMDAWRTEFIAEDGTITPDTQATLVRGLAFNLVPDELRRSSAGRLVELIRRAGTHLGTGFLSTPFLLPVLAEHGHLDVAYELLFQHSDPSWLAMVDRGATTVWEEWRAVDDDGTVSASLNHYSKGAVISFLHRHVAGLQIVDPGYRRFRFAPQPGGGLSMASATHDSPFGPIAVAWRAGTGRDWHFELTVPPNTTAEVESPGGQRFTLAPGTHSGVLG